MTAGDKVAIYMPMIPEAVVAMLACARLGAPHTVVFGGFSAEALRGRILDCDARVVITADGGYRRGAASALKPAVDEALAELPRRRDGPGGPPHRPGGRVERGPGPLVARGGRSPVRHARGRVLRRRAAAVHHVHQRHHGQAQRHPAHLGGYLTHVSATHRLIFDIKPETDICWTAADIGWVTGHSYIVYGPLANGVTSVMYEGTPDTADRDRWWEIVERYKVTILYTAPTTIRTFMKWGEDLPGRHDLSSLRLLGSVGEPINPEAWMWYRAHIGGDRCPIVDTWWQTETGGILITPLPGITTTKPGAAMTPFPGIAAEVVDNEGRLVGQRRGRVPGHHPAVARHAAGDLGRPRAVPRDLLVAFPRAVLRRRRRQEGRGRRPVAARSGRRRHEHLGPPHLDHRGRARSGRPPGRGRGGGGGGQRRHHRPGHRGLRHLEGRPVDGRGVGRGRGRAARPRGSTTIGPIAKPRQIILTPELPKTRSGKIMRRLLRDVAEHRDLGDVTTLLDPTVVNAISRADGHPGRRRGVIFRRPCRARADQLGAGVGSTPG